jgi:formylglycine-generating enzyme required for sulfatase activity
MERKRDVIRVFLASPSDVSLERQTTERIVGELNRSIAPKLGILVELVLWEDMVPGMGRPEQVILDQADIAGTDIFVGILWNRFGTPTGRADSGTEEEFQVAYQAWQQSGKPRIMLYFCQRPANFQIEQEIAQKTSVIRFRQQISNLGIVREFQEPSDFEAILRQDLTKHLLDIVGSVRGKGTLSVVSKPGIIRPQAVEKNLDNMALIPAGSFLAGRVQSAVSIDYDFYIDTTPVTNQQFLAFLEETGFTNSHLHPAFTEGIWRFRIPALSPPDHPVTSVTWYEAVAYAAWRGKRLPTAIEWEKAARGTDGYLFPWGNEFAPTRCNSLESGIGGTTPVFKYENGRSPYGCFDMAGNVFEWTNDWAQKPRFTGLLNSEKINRGASYNRSAADLMCWYEESDPPRLRMIDVGFRCVFVPNEN